MVVIEAFLAYLLPRLQLNRPVDSGNHLCDERRVEVYLSHLHLPRLHISLAHNKLADKSEQEK